MNKQKAKRAELTNSQSLKPYMYPNDFYYDRSKTELKAQVPSSKRYTKLVPIYQSKEYSKLKSLLPTVQNDKDSKFSLIEEQI